MIARNPKSSSLRVPDMCSQIHNTGFFITSAGKGISVPLQASGWPAAATATATATAFATYQALDNAPTCSPLAT